MVINMSSRQLSHIETDLLAKGLNFSTASKTLPNIILCYVMLCILYNLQKTNKYRLIDVTLTPEDQVWPLAVVTTAAATAYSD